VASNYFCWSAIDCVQYRTEAHNFQKILGPPQYSRCQQCDMK